MNKYVSTSFDTDLRATIIGILTKKMMGAEKKTIGNRIRQNLGDPDFMYMKKICLRKIYY